MDTNTIHQNGEEEKYMVQIWLRLAWQKKKKWLRFCRVKRIGYWKGTNWKNCLSPKKKKEKKKKRKAM